jgi:hypothetical protein
MADGAEGASIGTAKTRDELARGRRSSRKDSTCQVYVSMTIPWEPLYHPVGSCFMVAALFSGKWLRAS